MITQKPVYSERNPFGPRADRLSFACAVDDSIGSSLVNLGLDYPTQIPATSSGMFSGKIRSAAPADAGDRWFSDDEGDFLYLAAEEITGSATSQWYARILQNNSVDAFVLSRGTICIRFSFQNLLSGNDQYILHSGSAASSSHRLTVYRSATDGYLYLSFNGELGGTVNAYILRHDTLIAEKEKYTLVVTWGERGLNAWIDGSEFSVISSGSSPTSHFVIGASEELRIGRDDGNDYGDVNFISFLLWDVQLYSIERSELFADAHINFRHRAIDYTGSGSVEIFRTDVNPIIVRPTTTDITSVTQDEVTISVVTSKTLPFEVYIRAYTDTDPNFSNPVLSSVVSDDLPDHQLNLTISGLHHATTYYCLSQYSVDGSNWEFFPGGMCKFKTQKRVNSNYNIAFITDDHICDTILVGPPLDTLNPYPGYGGDTLRYMYGESVSANKLFHAWRTFYDIYINQDVDFIVVGGDFYFPDNSTVYSPDTDASDNPQRMAQTWRNWCNLLYKCGICFYVLGEHENEAGFIQRSSTGSIYTAQLRSTIARKKFFPNPTNDTYPQGGEYETFHSGQLNWIPDQGNNWVPSIDGVSEDPTGITPATSTVAYDLDYRNVYILGIDPEDPYVSTFDPYAINRSPLENYYAWTWADTLFVVLDFYRYTEPGDPTNSGGTHYRSGPVLILGIAQTLWLQEVLANSKESSKVIFIRNIPGEAINDTGNVAATGEWIGSGSGANINKTSGVDGLHPYQDTSDTLEESPAEIFLHNLFKQHNVTVVVKGRDHKFCHVINDEVNYVTGTTVCANQYESDGIRNSYGHTENQNNSASIALGIQSTSNNLGYTVFRCVSSTWSVNNRITAYRPFDEDDLANKEFTNAMLGGSSGPGSAGLLFTPDSDGAVTLDETPWDIVSICTESDGQFSSPPMEANIFNVVDGIVDANNLYTGQNDWEEFHESTTIQVESSSVLLNGEDVHVAYIPATIYESDSLLVAVDADQPTSVFHNVSPDSVVFVYNINVEGSAEVAQYYREKRNLPAQNLIGLDMPIPNPPASCETPISKSEFESTILLPIRSYLDSLSESNSESSELMQSSTIILGYGTPLSYTEDDGEVVAIASRLHRVQHDYISDYPNPTYDRKQFKFYDASDSRLVYLTAVLDGPSPAAVMKLIDRAIDVDNQTSITGQLYVDPYGRRVTAEDLVYENDVLDFLDKSAENLGLQIQTTVEIDSEDPYEEPTFTFFRKDSFYWGTFEPNFSKDLFLNQSEKRVFLYNADVDSACQIHYLNGSSPFSPQGSDPWCNLAINIEPGYAACAGSVANPGADGYLRPRPFFETLQQGASLGEAFLFASPLLNSKTILIGDPMMTVAFPTDLPADLDQAATTIPNNEAIIRVKETLEESLAWGIRQAELLRGIRDINVQSANISEEIDLLYALAKWTARKDDQTHYNLITRPAENFMHYILYTTGLRFQQWLESQQQKTTILFNAILKQLGSDSIPDEDTDLLLHPQGHWTFDFVYTHLLDTFERVHFEIQMASDEEFGQIVVNTSSFVDIDGWRYEAEPYVFVQMSDDGMASNYSGRRVRFNSPSSMYLTRTHIFNVRWRALDGTGSPIGDYQYSSKKLIIKR